MRLQIPLFPKFTQSMLTVLGTNTVDWRLVNVEGGGGGGVLVSLAHLRARAQTLIAPQFPHTDFWSEGRKSSFVSVRWLQRANLSTSWAWKCATKRRSLTWPPRGCRRCPFSQPLNSAGSGWPSIAQRINPSASPLTSRASRKRNKVSSSGWVRLRAWSVNSELDRSVPSLVGQFRTWSVNSELDRSVPSLVGQFRTWSVNSELGRSIPRLVGQFRTWSINYELDHTRYGSVSGVSSELDLHAERFPNLISAFSKPERCVFLSLLGTVPHRPTAFSGHDRGRKTLEREPTLPWSDRILRKNSFYSGWKCDAQISVSSSQVKRLIPIHAEFDTESKELTVNVSKIEAPTYQGDEVWQFTSKFAQLKNWESVLEFGQKKMYRFGFQTAIEDMGRRVRIQATWNDVSC